MMKILQHCVPQLCTRSLIGAVAKHLHTAVACVGLICAAPMSSPAQTYPAGFSQVRVGGTISKPTALAFAPDGRIFVAEQAGKLRVIKNGALLATSFVQLSVNSTNERGLLGIALDPDFATNQYVYLYYTVPSGTIRNRISRFTANGDVVVPGSEVVLLNLDPLTATYHNGGAMRFGPDGKLYVAVGENAVPENSQNLDTYLGKLLRLNPDGSAPADNPFPSGSASRRRVWASGLRNPFTLAVQPGTGRIFVNDVGYKAWEEINEATAGGRNFGWPAAEGNSTNSAYTNPVFAYAYGGTSPGQACAITGGTFFNPAASSYPASYTGRYFYQDFCSNTISMLTLAAAGATSQVFATGIPASATGIAAGPDGNLYFLSRDNNALYKIGYSSNTAPAIASQPAPVTVSAGQPASFSVSATGAASLTYQWQKDGVAIAGATAATYSIAGVAAADAGQYRVVVTNAAGTVTSNAAALTITGFNAAPTATINTPVAGITYQAGTTISFSGTGTDPEDGTLPASAFTWLLDFHHATHVHDSPPIATGTKSGSFDIGRIGEKDANVFYRLSLVVTDAQGLTTTTYRDIYPRTSTIRLATFPAGLSVTLDGTALQTPVAVLGVEGVTRSLGPVSPQPGTNVVYEFEQWAHGGSATQDINTPTDDVTYTAEYSYVVDNASALFNSVGGSGTGGTWTASTGIKGYYGANYLADGDNGANAATKAATWTSPITATGTYEVYMRWTAASNRPTNVPVVVNYNGGWDTVSVNQQVNGGQWVRLGTWSFTGGSGDLVKVLATGAGATIADAVKWVKAPAVSRTARPAAGLASSARQQAVSPPADFYPNPVVDGFLRVQLFNEQAEQADVVLCNALGQEVRRHQQAVGAHGQLQLNVRGLPAGSYSATVHFTASGQHFRHHVFIQD